LDSDYLTVIFRNILNPVAINCNSKDKKISSFFCETLAKLFPQIAQRVTDLINECQTVIDNENNSNNLAAMAADLAETASRKKMAHVFLQICVEILCLRVDQIDAKTLKTMTLDFPYNLNNRGKYCAEPSQFFKEILAILEPAAKVWIKGVFDCLAFLLTCKYSEIATKCIQPLTMLIKTLIKEDKVTSDSLIFNQSEAMNIFSQLIKALEMHGHVEETLNFYLALAYYFYKKIKPIYPIKETILSAENINQEFFLKFDALISPTFITKASEKAISSNFKNAFDSFIAKPLSRKFEMNIDIKNLTQKNNIGNLTNRD